jgi:hypothetical protein
LFGGFQRIFGAHAFQVTSRDEVIGKFNGHLQDCILFVADEAYWGGDGVHREGAEGTFALLAPRGHTHLLPKPSGSEFLATKRTFTEVHDMH